MVYFSPHALFLQARSHLTQAYFVLINIACIHTCNFGRWYRIPVDHQCCALLEMNKLMYTSTLKLLWTPKLGYDKRLDLAAGLTSLIHAAIEVQSVHLLISQTTWHAAIYCIKWQNLHFVYYCLYFLLLIWCRSCHDELV